MTSRLTGRMDAVRARGGICLGNCLSHSGGCARFCCKTFRSNFKSVNGHMLRGLRRANGRAHGWYCSACVKSCPHCGTVEADPKNPPRTGDRMVFKKASAKALRRS